MPDAGVRLGSWAPRDGTMPEPPERALMGRQLEWTPAGENTWWSAELGERPAEQITFAATNHGPVNQ